MVELGLGYDFIHLAGAAEADHLHGFDTSVFVNIASWFAVGGEFIAAFGNGPTRFGSDISESRYVYVLGPRLSIWTTPKVRVFVQALTGSAHAKLEAEGGFLRDTATADAFALSAGAGVDWRFSEHFYWRVIQADYLRMHFTGQEDNWRISTGIVFAFGGKR
ncbi:MAG: hypothetical protein M3R29_07425 [Verrucomicrobiota bacterium]|nr:hypothetical protein [Verrucomicrobiota bacterium]